MGMSLGIGLGLTHGRGGGANPVSILGSSLKAWWTADRPDLITLSGAQVTSWRDVVGAYDAVQAVSASRFVYDAASFNGAPSMALDGVDDEMTLAPVPAGIPTGATPSEAWAIVQQDALPGDTGPRYIASWGGVSGGLRRGPNRLPVTGVNRGRSLSGNGTSDLVAADTVVDFSTRHAIRSEQAATETRVSIDGGAVTAAAAALASTGTTRLRIGALTPNVASLFWKGHIRDFLITAPLTADQAMALWAWALPRRKR